MVLILIPIIRPDRQNDNPRKCSICAHTANHAPYLLNLATGEMEALELYSPETIQHGAIRPEERTGGVFSFCKAAGLQGIRLSDPWYIEIRLPEQTEPIDETLYCDDCRALIGAATGGYALIDLYGDAAPQIAPIVLELSYKVRCYSIYVLEDSATSSQILRIDGLLE